MAKVNTKFIPVATNIADGLISATDKARLDTTVPEAPADGRTYCRKDTGWVEAMLSGVLATELNNLRAEVAGILANLRFIDKVNLGALTGSKTAKISSNKDAFVLVEELGLFKFSEDSHAPADGETCLLPEIGDGRWHLILPDVNLLFALSGFKPKVLSASAVLAWTAISRHGGTLERAINLIGAEVGDVVNVIPPLKLISGLFFSGNVRKPDEVSVRCVNLTAAAITPATASWTVRVSKGAS